MSLSSHLSHPDVLVLDVRSPDECACCDGYVNAKNIPVGEVPKRFSECGPDKCRPIVCYCKAGVRAANAASVLKQNGYTNVISAPNADALRAATRK